MPRKTTAKQPTKKQSAPTGAFIDDVLMKRAIALYSEGKTMKTIGEELNVKATGYLAKKIRDTYGPDALARTATQGSAQASPETPPSEAAATPRKRAARKPATEAKG